ncbi:glycosyltransferase [Nocardioides mesophilus]|uniref:Glycosyltransferase n=1 Tax=Nocardioides mesophilus TaxID=433659 RepID=A0A7G9R943_9ACTN|nr:glycosyltransferase [Nocardioides mesophilus]QNN52118.1 glycosyltransferase [Nocardioides mesophilus]
MHGVLVTFRRPLDLADSLQRIGSQTRPLDTLLVVDNAAEVETERLVSQHPHVAGEVRYLAAPDNLGPAGGLALGVESVLDAAADEDWVMFLDDDDPPRTDHVFADVTTFADEMLDHHSGGPGGVGGVGLVGGRFDTRRGLGTRLPDPELEGPVQVSYIGGGQFPCYRVGAVRSAGGPSAPLFFGFDDLEFGLRLASAGYPLFVSGQLWLEERRVRGRLGLTQAPARELGAPGWRDYYATRNLIWILRRRSALGAARVVLRRVLVKPIINLPRHPRYAAAHLRLGVRAAFDGYAGRLGRRVEPSNASKR